MDNQFEVEPENLAENGAGIGRVGENLQTLWQQFSSQVEAMGDIFGDDDVSSLIATSYQAAHQIAADSIGTVVESLAGFGTGLQEMAARYAEADEQIADGFRRLLR
ncbi:PE family protein [Micromonospora pisi]|uniref:PE family protein n=1 Tax=Micromonospora pisi TaxID=589240 RepID=A0A495JF60_9ACTN|nr:type VII secretion target [Micromonospora pisi]RKR87024.1 PE family protein [Micromonospora pisi]